MTKSTRIVVGVDGSPASQDAVVWAITEAASRNSELDVVHAWSPWVTAWALPSPVAQQSPSAELDAKTLLENETERGLAAAPAKPTIVRTRLLRGEPALALTTDADGADELVVGADGLGALKRFVLGSVADAVVRQARTTVTAVPHLETQGDGRVVVGVDSSSESLAALRWAFNAARRRKAPLVVVHAVPSILDLAGQTGRAYATGNGRLLVEDLVASVDTGDGGPSSLSIVSVFGQAAQVLLEEAQGASQLVVGTHSTGVFSGLTGDTARKCVHHAPCAVTVVKLAAKS